MLTLRRFAAVLIGMVFALALPVAVFAVRFDQTLLSANYYTDQLRDRGVYEFLMVDLLESAARDALNSPAEALESSEAERFLEESDLTAEQIVDAVHQGLSPEQLQALVEPAILEFVGYVTAEQDEARIRFDAGPVARGLLRGGLDLLRQGGFYEWVVDAEILPAVGEYSEDALSADPEFVAQIVRQVITPGWLAATVEEVAVPVVDYVFGESEGFAIRVGLSESQAAVVASEVADTLPGQELVGLVRTHVLTPAIADEISSIEDPQLGFTPPAEAVVAAILSDSSAGSIERQLDSLANELGGYLAGRSDGFSTQFDFTATKDSARSELESLVRGQILTELESLPQCSGQTDSIGAVAGGSPPTLPTCLPPGVTPEELLDQSYAETATAASDQVLDAIPDRIAFSESDLNDATDLVAGAGSFESIDDWRSLVGEGFEYTHLDMRADLESAGDLEEFDEFRSFFADGIVISADGSSSEGFAEDAAAELEEFRNWVAEYRRGVLVSIAVAAVLLLIAGLLAGNTGPSRLLWASAILLAASLFWLLIFWPAFEIGLGAAEELAKSEVDVSDAGAFSDTAILASNYSIESAFVVAGDFMNGPQLAFGVLSALGIAGIFGAHDWRQRQREQVNQNGT